MTSTSSLIKKLSQAASKCSQREISMITVMFVSIVFALIYLGYLEVDSYLEDSKRLLNIRTQTLKEISKVLERYKNLQGRLNSLKATFAESELSFEEVTAQIDKIVKTSIGNDNYELKKGRSPTKVGLEYEKQDFTLNIPAISQDQAVKLLFQLEQGESPLFLGKVDFSKTSREGNLSIAIEIFSIKKS